MKVLVTGAKGFIAGYLIEELLSAGYSVVGIDNNSKYGEVEKSYDNHPHYKFFYGDVKNLELMKTLITDCDHVIAVAAMIGGISYFHAYAYDLLAENERITAATFDAAIWAHRNSKLKKITVLSSSMVFENATLFPTPEGHQQICPPPFSTYGFQKLSCEYFALGAWEQYQLPYTILRPFNCVGTGEKRAVGGSEVKSGNVSLAMTHVVPDLVQKILKGQDPLRILGSGEQVRHYTYGGDLARGIRIAMEHEAARNNDFNLSTAQSTTVIELARLIWDMINPDKPFRFESDEPYSHDVQMRVPNVYKAKNILGYEAVTPLKTALEEIIPWIKHQIDVGGM